MNYPEKGTSHRAHLNRLKRIEGQLKAVIKNVEDQKYCICIVDQIKSIRAALNSFELEVVKGHLNGCVKEAMTKPDGDPEEKIKQLISLFEKTYKIK